MYSYCDGSRKEEVREEGKKGLRKPSPEEEAWQNRSCDLPNFTNMVKYLHKRVSNTLLLILYMWVKLRVATSAFLIVIFVQLFPSCLFFPSGQPSTCIRPVLLCCQRQATVPSPCPSGGCEISSRLPRQQRGGDGGTGADQSNSPGHFNLPHSSGQDRQV